MQAGHNQQMGGSGASELVCKIGGKQATLPQNHGQKHGALRGREVGLYEVLEGLSPLCEPAGKMPAVALVEQRDTDGIDHPTDRVYMLILHKPSKLKTSGIQKATHAMEAEACYPDGVSRQERQCGRMDVETYTASDGVPAGGISQPRQAKIEALSLVERLDWAIQRAFDGEALINLCWEHVGNMIDGKGS